MKPQILAPLSCLLILAGAGMVYRSGPEAPATPAPHTAGASAVMTASVRVAGVMINSPLRTGSDPSVRGAVGVDLAFMGTHKRTRVALELDYPGGGVLDVDVEASSLSLFEDDMGTNLRDPGASFGPFELMTRRSQDGRFLAFVLPSGKAPYSTATTLHAEGVVAVQVAKDAQEFVSDSIALNEGSTFSVGGYEFEIVQIEQASFGKGHSITVRTAKDTAAILRYCLIDSDGLEVELTPTINRSGTGTWQQTLRYDRPLAVASLRVECWQDLRTVEVPFEVEVGLGLPRF